MASQFQKKYFAFAIAAAGLLLSFQNCSKTSFSYSAESLNAQKGISAGGLITETNNLETGGVKQPLARRPSSDSPASGIAMTSTSNNPARPKDDPVAHLSPRPTCLIYSAGGSVPNAYLIPVTTVTSSLVFPDDLNNFGQGWRYSKRLSGFKRGWAI